MYENCFGLPMALTRRGRILQGLTNDCQEHYKTNSEHVYYRLKPYILSLPKLVTPYRHQWVSLASIMLVSADLIDRMVSQGYADTCSDPRAVRLRLEKRAYDFRYAVGNCDETVGREFAPVLWGVKVASAHFTACTTSACSCPAGKYHELIKGFRLNKHAKANIYLEILRTDELPEGNPLAFIPQDLPGLPN